MASNTLLDTRLGAPDEVSQHRSDRHADHHPAIVRHEQQHDEEGIEHLGAVEQRLRYVSARVPAARGGGGSGRDCGRGEQR